MRQDARGTTYFILPFSADVIVISIETSPGRRAVPSSQANAKSVFLKPCKLPTSVETSLPPKRSTLRPYIHGIPDSCGYGIKLVRSVYGHLHSYRFFYD